MWRGFFSLYKGSRPCRRTDRNEADRKHYTVPTSSFERKRKTDESGGEDMGKWRLRKRYNGEWLVKNEGTDENGRDVHMVD